MSKLWDSYCWQSGWSEQLVGHGFLAGICPLDGEGRRKTPDSQEARVPPSPPFFSPYSTCFPSTMSFMHPGSRKQVFGKGILMGVERKASHLSFRDTKPELAQSLPR